MERFETVELRCDDRAENLIMTKVGFDDEPTWYEFGIEDAYLGGAHQGIVGRFQRAWHAFWDNPICYAGIIVQDAMRVKHF